MPAPLERPLDGPREVVVAPALGHLPARDADPDAEPVGPGPGDEGVADRRRPQGVGVPLEDDLAEPGGEGLGRCRVGAETADLLGQVVRVGPGREPLAEQVVHAALAVS